MKIPAATLLAQYTRARQLWPYIDEINDAYGLLPRLLYAVGSRETNLDPKYTQGATGDGGHGRGLFQLDDRWHKIPAGFDRDPRAQALKAAQMLAENHKRFGDWLSALNAYNSGKPSTASTTGKDYGPDVLQRQATLAGAGAPTVAGTPGLPTFEAVRHQFARWDGTVEGPRNNEVVFNDWYYGRKVYGAAYPWCGAYVSYALYHAGIPIPATTTKGFVSTVAGASWFQKRGRWTRTPTVGALVFFYWPNMGRIAHVGWVVRVDPDGSFWSWEGNTDVRGGRTGGRVLLQHRSAASIGKGGGFGLIEYGQDVVRPQDEEEDMFIFGIRSDDMSLDGVWLLAGDGKAHHVPTPEDWRKLTEAGIRDIGGMSVDFLRRFERVHPLVEGSMP